MTPAAKLDEVLRWRAELTRSFFVKQVLRDFQVLGPLRDGLSFGQEALGPAELSSHLFGGVASLLHVWVLSCPAVGHYRTLRRGGSA